MAKTTFKNPIQIGKDTGVPATTSLGTLVAEQNTTVVSNASGASSLILKANSRIVDMVVHIEATASANTQGMLIRVGDADDVDKFASIKCSAAGTYRPGSPPNAAAASAAAWKGVGASAMTLHIDVTAATSATQVDNFQGVLSVLYIPGET